MDKRKLKVGKFTRMGDTCLELETRGLCAIMGAGNQKTREEDAAELAKRWNEYPQQAERIAKLEKALEECADLLYASADEKAEAGSYGRDCHKAETKARALLQTLKPSNPEP